MITETGRIVAVESDCVWVETIRQSTCNSCSVQKGCGHGLMNKVDAGRLNHVRALLAGSSPELFAINDVVRISIPEKVLVQGALLVYLLPLLTMLGGGLLVSHFWVGDVIAAFGALAGLGLGFALVRWHAFRTRDDASLQPSVLPDPRNAVQCLTPIDTTLNQSCC